MSIVVTSIGGPLMLAAAFLAQALGGSWLIHVVVILIVVGVLLWLVESVIPMDPQVRQIIRVVIIVAVVLYLLNILLGIF